MSVARATLTFISKHEQRDLDPAGAGPALSPLNSRPPKGPVIKSNGSSARVV